MSYDFLPKHKLKISYQVTPDGEQRYFSLPTWSFAVMVVVFVLLLVSSLISLFGGISNRTAKLKQLEIENVSLRNKLDFYATTVDSIYAMLDSLQVKTAAPEKVFPSYGNNTATQQTDFAYDPELKEQINDLEQKLVFILGYVSGSGEAVPAPSALSPVDLLPDSVPSIYPGFGRISDGWGLRVHPVTNQIEFHYGIDIANQMGTPVYATARGIVSKLDYDQGYGKRIVVSHDGGYETLYAHLYSYQVRMGDEVGKGQIIGLMGNSGLSTGPHLHYEVHKSAEKVNPTAYLNRIDEPGYAMR